MITLCFNTVRRSRCSASWGWGGTNCSLCINIWTVPINFGKFFEVWAGFLLVATSVIVVNGVSVLCEIFSFAFHLYCGKGMTLNIKVCCNILPCTFCFGFEWCKFILVIGPQMQQTSDCCICPDCWGFSNERLLWTICCRGFSNKCLLWAIRCRGFSNKCFLWAICCRCFSNKCLLWAICCRGFSNKCLLWAIWMNIICMKYYNKKSIKLRHACRKQITYKRMCKMWMSLQLLTYGHKHST